MRTQFGLGLLAAVLISTAQALPQFSTTSPTTTTTTTSCSPTTDSVTTSTSDAGTTTDPVPHVPTTGGGTTTDSVTPTPTGSSPCTRTTQWELGSPQCGGLHWRKPWNCSHGYHCIMLEPTYGQCGKIVVTCQHHSAK